MTHDLNYNQSKKQNCFMPAFKPIPEEKMDTETHNNYAKSSLNQVEETIDSSVNQVIHENQVTPMAWDLSISKSDSNVGK